MKVCLINNLYKPYVRGGAERVVELIADGWREAGHEVFVITTKPIFKKLEITNVKYKIYNISALYYNLDQLPKILRFFWHTLDMFDVGSYWQIKSILIKEKPDIVITHNLKGIGYLIPIVIKNINIKHIHTLHDIQLLHPSGLMIYSQEKKINSRLAKIYSCLCLWLFNSITVVISPSDWLLSEHVKRGFFKKAKKIILPNPTCQQIFFPVSKEKSEKVSKEFHILYVGQIEKHKGILFLIKTFNKLPGKLGASKCKLIIVGDGSKIKKAKELAQKNNNIKFIGQQKADDVKRLMKESNCLLVPSLCYENSPMVIYEALSIGLPVVASRLGGITELIHNFGGILFKPGREKDLASKIKWAINHPLELHRIGEKGKNKTSQLRIENYINKLIELI